jgi:hypothetical protein
VRFCPNLKQLSDTLTEVRHEAVQIMEEKRLLNLPVTMNGKVAYSINDTICWGLGSSLEWWWSRNTGLASLTAPLGPFLERRKRLCR